MSRSFCLGLFTMSDWTSDNALSSNWRPFGVRRPLPLADFQTPLFWSNAI